MAKKKTEKPESRLPSEEDKRLREFTQEFLADWRADSEFRKNSKEDNDFYDGKQLSQEEIETLEERGQPPVTINRIKPKLDAIFGMQQAMRVDTKAYPAGEREVEAQELSEFLRRIEDDNDFDDAESLAFEEICVAGRAFYEIGKKWDGLSSRHFVKKAFLEDVTPCRKSRLADLSDAKRIHQSVWMDLDDAQALFPHAKEQLRHSADEKALDLAADPENRRVKPDQYRQGVVGRDDLREFADLKNRRVRIVKTYYRTQEPRRFYFHAQLPSPADVTDLDAKSFETLKAAHPNGHVVTQPDKKLHCYTFTWNAELEHIKDIRNYDPEAKFPFVMIEGYREKNGQVPYGLVRQMKDPQREVNKRRSKSLHLISVNRTIFEEGTFKNPGAMKDEVQKPDAWIEVLPNMGGKFQLQNNLDMGATHFQLLQQATAEIDAAGVSKELEGRSGASSGRDFQLRQQQAVQPIRKIVSNLRSGRRRAALYLMDEFNQEHPDLALQKHDVVVEEAPDTLNLQQETFDKLAGFAEKGIVPPGFVQLLLQASNLDPAMKKKFNELFEAQKQAQMAALQAQAQVGAAGAVPSGGVQ